MKMYKLLTQDMCSYGNTEWELGVTKRIHKAGKTMCTDQVLHCYNNPYLAVIFNQIHGNIRNPRLFEIETPEPVVTDGLKYGTKHQTLIEEIDLPEITDEQRIEFAIRVTMLVCQDAKWMAWANRWLSGKDRSSKAAKIAADYARAAADYARVVYADYAAANAAYAAAYAAYAAYDAVCVARAENAADAVYAARAAYAAAYDAAYDAEFNHALLGIVAEVFKGR